MHCGKVNESVKSVAHGSYYIFRKKAEVSIEDRREVTVCNYELVYAAPLFYDMSVEQIINSKEFPVEVTDVITVVNRMYAYSYLVESSGFSPVREFFAAFDSGYEMEVAFSVSDRFIAFRMTDEGCSYDIFDTEYELLDGGIYDDMEVPFFVVIDDVLRDFQKPLYCAADGNFYYGTVSGCMADATVYMPVSAEHVCDAYVTACEMRMEVA